ncbi:MAG TPA: hypothetical protein VFZ53_22885 [Polyangiaceae bacterium]
MTLETWFTGNTRVASAAVLACVVALGCSGKSERNGDGDDDDARGGTSGAGGTSGTSGTGGTSGAGRGGSGGTSASTATCIAACERLQDCPDTQMLDCASECPGELAEAARFGCEAPMARYLECVASLSDVCVSLEPCADVAEALAACLSGESGICTEGAAPSGASCVSLCERAQPCSGEGVNCEGECTIERAHVEVMGCTSAYQAFLDCADTCQNLCNFSSSDCPDSFDAYSTCVEDFCAANPTSPACDL